MSLKRLFLWFAIVSFVVIAGEVEAQERVDETSPTEIIQEIDQEFENFYPGPDLSSEEEAVNRTLKSEMLATYFDMTEFCRRALGYHWQKLSPYEQEAFVELMTTLMERKPLFTKEHVRTERHPYYETVYAGDFYIDGDPAFAQAQTKILIPHENMAIDVSYRMKREPFWKIYDVLVDGSSLLYNYRYQFDRIITNDGFEELLRRLEEKAQ